MTLPGIRMVKTIDGKQFHLIHTYSRKAGAEERASHIRTKGFPARVIEVRVGFSVYSSRAYLMTIRKAQEHRGYH